MGIKKKFLNWWFQSILWWLNSVEVWTVYRWWSKRRIHQGKPWRAISSLHLQWWMLILSHLSLLLMACWYFLLFPLVSHFHLQLPVWNSCWSSKPSGSHINKWLHANLSARSTSEHYCRQRLWALVSCSCRKHICSMFLLLFPLLFQLYGSFFCIFFCFLVFGL